MSAVAVSDFATASTRFAIPAGIKAIQLRLLWLVGASGSIVFFEPSPYEIMIAVTAVIFVATGLKLYPPILIPLFLLIVTNIGYCVGAASIMDSPDVLNWILTSWYMAITAILFSTILIEDTHDRLKQLSSGYLFGAIIASLAGLVGYFNLVPSQTELLTLSSRARGTFKDPNVLGAFLIFPAIYCVQRIIESAFLKAIWFSALLGILSLAVFFAFSRAAWGMFAGGVLLAVVLWYATEQSSSKRLKIIVLTFVTVAVACLAVTALLSSSSIASLFKERASLDQPYDSGRFGRFGRHLLGAIMALDYPLGIGPLEFRRFFPEDTHNSFLNAFMSGGWISGTAYPVLIFLTTVNGIRNLFYRTPWRKMYITVFSAFIVTLAESFIIDTDHWRHYFMLVGLVWGISVANRHFGKSYRAAGGLSA